MNTRINRHTIGGWFIWTAFTGLMFMFLASVCLLFVGCQTSRERAAHTTIKSANIAVDAAMQTYATETVRRERVNDLSRATDPDGYLDRQRNARLLHRRVSDAKNAYRDAVNVAVTLWLMQKSDRANAPPEPLVTAEVTASLNRLLKHIKP